MTLRCTGCGSVESIEEIRARHPQALSCCPERRMQDDRVEAVKAAIRDEVGSQLCRMNDDGKRSCHGPVCFCRDAACAAIETLEANNGDDGEYER